MNNPDLILADEPTGNLDEENTEILLKLLFDLRKMENVSILLITHEKDIARRSDIIYELSKGKLKAV
jgi:lipoprotein-releasing system ATP-binding protein